MFERIPPQDIEAECAVLGACLIEESAALVASQGLVPDDFYRQAHVIIFKAIQSIVEDAGQPDVLVLRDLLKRDGNLERVGGTEYIHQLPSAVPSAANIDGYIQTVKWSSSKRSLITVATQALRDAEDPSCDPVEARGALEKSLRTLDATDAVWSTTAEVMSHAEEEASYPTGLTEVDQYTGGMMCGLNILAGNAGAGKSTLGLQQIAKVLKEGNAACVLGSDQKLSGQGKFIWANISRKPDKEYNEFTDEYFKMADWPLSWYTGRFDLSAILAAIRLRAARGVRWFMVDYLGLIQAKGYPNQHERKEGITEALKRVAHENKLYIILISRGNKVGFNERPAMRHVEGGAGVANAADQVWWLEPDMDDPQKIELLNFKSRQSTRGKLVIKLIGSQHRFEDWDNAPDWARD